MKRILILIIFLSTHIFTVNSFSYYSSDTGHYYQVVSKSSTWIQARQESIDSGGYLVSISSQTEQNWLYDTFGTTLDGKLIGAYQYDKLDEPSGHWQWVEESSETWGYTNWNSGEPNNGVTNPYGEDVAHFYSGTSGKWNDLPDTASTNGYIIEYTQNTAFQWSSAEGGNDHYYMVIDSSVTWETARTEAAALGGYLVTITSQEESDWLMLNFGTDYRHIGAYQPNNDLEPDGNWQWVEESGDEWSYTNWAAGEPNDSPADVKSEDVVMIWNADGEWNDAYIGGSRPYFVEFNFNPNLPQEAAVPEPATVCLMLSGLLGVVARLKSGIKK